MMGYHESMREEEAEMVREQQLQEDILIQDAKDLRHMNRMRMRAAESISDEEEVTTGRNVRQRSEA